MTFTDVKILVPAGMEPYVVYSDQNMVMKRNALLLYPYIKNLTISHGKAAEILGIHKTDLIELYEEFGLPYLDMDISEVEEEVLVYKRLKEEKHANNFRHYTDYLAVKNKSSGIIT